MPNKESEALTKRLAITVSDTKDKFPVPSPKAPLGPKAADARLLLGLTTEFSLNLPPEQMKAHSAASVFPGSVPETAKRCAKRVSLKIDPTGYVCNGVGVTAKADIWHATGIYPAPGS